MEVPIGSGVTWLPSASSAEAGEHGVNVFERRFSRFFGHDIAAARREISAYVGESDYEELADTCRAGVLPESLAKAARVYPEHGEAGEL